jgi:hypothetical protein
MKNDTLESNHSSGGRELIDVIKGFKCWALKWKIDNKVCEHLDCSDCRLKKVHLLFDVVTDP